MTELHLTPEDLIGTANTLDHQVTALQSLEHRVHECRVPSGAFGRIPGIGPHIDDIYEQHVSDSTDVVQKATDGLDHIVKSLHATAESFLQIERRMAQNLGKVDHQ